MTVKMKTKVKRGKTKNQTGTEMAPFSFFFGGPFHGLFENEILVLALMASAATKCTRTGSHGSNHRR